MTVKELDINNYGHIKRLITYLVGHKGFVCGGCFKNLFLKEKPKDIDIFFHSQSDFSEALLHYRESKDIYTQLYESDKAICFVHKDGTRIDLVNNLFGSPKWIIEQFDFTITKAYYEYYATSTGEDEWEYTHNLVVHEDYFEHLLTKRTIVDDKLLFPCNTFERIIRYVQKGYLPCRGTKVRLLRGIYDEICRLVPAGLDVTDALLSDILSKSLYAGVD